MKIAFDAHVLDGRYQGSRTTILRLAEAMASKPGAEVVLLTANPVTLNASLPNLRREAVEHGGSFARLFDKLPKAVAKLRPDATIFQYIASPFTPNGVVVLHDILPYTHKQYFPFLFRLRCNVMYYASCLVAKQIFVVSEYSAREALKWMPWARGKLHVARNGPSFLPRDYLQPADRGALPAEVRDIGPYVLAVGRIEPRKNVHLLAKAFARAKPPGVRLVVVGKHDLGFAFNDWPGGTVFLEGVDDASLMELYRNAALFVYPSAAEGFGLPLLDAVLFGAPTLSSDRTAMPEVGGTLAEYFDPTRPDAEQTLAARLASHFSGAAPVKAPTEAERRAHLEAFSWERSADAILKVLEG